MFLAFSGGRTETHRYRFRAQGSGAAGSGGEPWWTGLGKCGLAPCPTSPASAGEVLLIFKGSGWAAGPIWGPGSLKVRLKSPIPLCQISERREPKASPQIMEDAPHILPAGGRLFCSRHRPWQCQQAGTP